MFKYIENVNKNWRNEGIKDEELRFFEDNGENESQKLEIDGMILSALLNISLCLLKKEKYFDLRKCCEDIVTRDPTSVKG